MEKVLSLLNEIKAYFSGLKEALAKLTAAEDRTKSLETELATAKAHAATTATRLSEAEAGMKAAQEQVGQRDAQIKALNEQLGKEKQRTNDTLAAQGIAADLLPSLGTSSNGSVAGETAWTKYQKLLATDPRAAGAFYAANAEAIFKSRP